MSIQVSYFSNRSTVLSSCFNFVASISIFDHLHVFSHRPRFNFCHSRFNFCHNHFTFCQVRFFFFVIGVSFLVITVSIFVTVISIFVIVFPIFFMSISIFFHLHVFMPPDLDFENLYS